MLTIAKGSAFQLKLFRLRLLFTQRRRFLIICCLTCIYIKQTATAYPFDRLLNLSDVLVSIHCTVYSDSQ